jgi:hypothetical protein
VTASSVSTTTKTGSDLEILLITTSGGETYLDLDVADYVSPAANFSNVLTGFNVSDLTSVYGTTAKLYKPDGTLLTTVNSAATGSGVNFGYTETEPGDVIYELEVTDDVGRKSKYNLTRKWINYAMETTSTPGFQKFALEGNEYTTSVMLPNLSSTSKARIHKTTDHGYMGINFKIQGRDDPSGAWTDIPDNPPTNVESDESAEFLAFGNYKYQRVWVKPTAKATTTVSSSNVVTLTLSNVTEDVTTKTITGMDPFEIDETSNVFVFEETAKIGTIPYTVTVGTETYTNTVTATTKEIGSTPNTDFTAAGPNMKHLIGGTFSSGYMCQASADGKYIAHNKTNDSVLYILKGDPVSGYTDYTTITYSQVSNANLVGSMSYDGKYIIIARVGSNSYTYEIWKNDESTSTFTKLAQSVSRIGGHNTVYKPSFVPRSGNYDFAITGTDNNNNFDIKLYKHTAGTDTWTGQTTINDPTNRPTGDGYRGYYSCQFTRDGKYLMMGAYSTYGGYQMYTIDWDANTAVFSGANWVQNGNIGHSGTVTLDGKYVLIFHNDSNSRKIFKNNDAGDWSSATDVTTDFTFNNDDNDQGHDISFFGDNSEYFVSKMNGGYVRVYSWYAKKEVTLAFANPTLTLTGQNVTISSAKLYKDDVLFHTYGTESNVVLRTDQTGTYQAIVNDVYYSNRVVPDFTTTRSVSAPQLEFDGYNKLTLANYITTTSDFPSIITFDASAWGSLWYVLDTTKSTDTSKFYETNVPSTGDVGNDGTATGIEFRCESDGTTKVYANTDDNTSQPNTLNVNSTSYPSNYVDGVAVTSGDVLYGVEGTFTRFGFNVTSSMLFTRTVITPTSTTLGLPDGTTRGLTTQSNVYIYKSGTYTANVQTSDTFAYLNNVATIQTVTQPTLVNTISITNGDFSGYNYQHEATDTTNTYYEYNLSLNATGSTYFIGYNWTTKKWFDTNPTDANNTFGISATDTTATSRETIENPAVVYVIGTNNSQIVLESQFINPYYSGPSLTFDGFNKLSIENITQTSSTITYPNGSTVNTNAVSDVYIKDIGEYVLEASDANTFVTSNVEVGALDTVPGFTAAFHHGAFSASDYSSAYSSVADAATAGYVYSDTPAGEYTWGTLAHVKERENPDFTANSTLHTDYSSTYGWTTNSGWEVSAKDEFSTTYEAWKAFNKNDGGDAWLSGSAPSASTPQWLKIKYPSSQVIKSYVIKARDNPSPRFPTAWKLQGSNNDSDWTDIGTEQTVSLWSIASEKSFDVSSNTTAYQYYRLRITGSRESASLSNSDYVAIGEWFLNTVNGENTTNHDQYTRYTYTPPASTITANVLRVAGGGGGGSTRGAGGGAGGLLYSENVSLSGAKSISVANGGRGCKIGGSGNQSSIQQGFDTTFSGLTTSVGGGRGAFSDPGRAGSGGSGGGGGPAFPTAGTGISGQGYAGGNSNAGDNYNGGGGGGAGGVGATGPGVGGVGLDYSSVFGTTYGVSGWFAGGGGGGQQSGGLAGGQGGGGTYGTNSGHGVKHTGGGGGGSGTSGAAGSGGSGIVIIKKLGATNPPALTFDGYNKLTIENDGNGDTGMKNVTISGGPWNNHTFKPDDNAQKGKFQWDLWSQPTGGSQYVSGGGHSLEYVVGYGWYILNQDGTGFGDVSPTSATAGTYVDVNGVTQNFSTNLASSSGGVLTIAHTGGTMTVNETDFFEGGVFPPKVGSLESVTIKKDGAAFATTTSNTVYIRDTGTYTAEVKGSGAYVTEVSKVVSTINNAPDWRETQFQLLYSENPNQNDYFGVCVDIDGDYACIGSPYDDTNAGDKGAVYVFHKSNGVWTYQDILQPDSTSENFAVSLTCLSIHGDTIAVGAQANDTGGTDFGAVYVFRRNGTSWSKEAKLQSNDVQTSDNFGSGVGIYGDYIVAGAYAEDSGGNRAGSAYIFKRTGTTWQQKVKIQSGDQSVDDKFGMNCKIYGDYVIVGALEEDIGGSEFGAAYIFKKNADETWSKTATLLASDGAYLDRIGNVCYIYDEYAIVGGPNKDNGGTDRGSAYIFKKNADESWTEQVILTSDDPTDNHRFGISTYIKGNYAIVGESGIDASTGGFMYVFERSGSTWTQVKKFQVTNGVNASFGSSVAISGDTILSGAPYDDVKSGNAGACYVFNKTPPGPYITYDGKNKLTVGGTNYADTSTVTYYSNTYNLGTAKTMYVKDVGEYVFKISGTDKYVESNVYVSSVDLAGATTKPISFDGYNKLTLISPGENAVSNVTLGATTYDLGSASTFYIKDTGTYDLEMSGSNVFALSSNVVGSISSLPDTLLHLDFESGGLVSTGLNTTQYKYGSSSLYRNNSSVTVSNDGSYNIGNTSSAEATIMLWVRPESYPSYSGDANRIIVAADGRSESSPSYKKWAIVLREHSSIDEEWQFHYPNSSNTNRVVSYAPADIPVGAWYHVCVTIESGSLKFYIDGVDVTSSLTGSKSDIESAWAGFDDDEGFKFCKTDANYLKGWVDDFKLFNSVLTLSEITAHMNASKLSSPSLTFDNYNKLTVSNFDSAGKEWPPASFTSPTFSSSTITGVTTTNNAKDQTWTISGAAYGNGEYSASFDGTVLSNANYHGPVRCFDKVNDGYAFHSHSVPTGIVTLNMPENIILDSYELRHRPNANTSENYAPRDWTLEASNDGTTWVVLDTQSNQSYNPDVQGDEASKRTYTVSNNSTSYSRYRLNITANDGGGHLVIGQWKLFEKNPRTATLTDPNGSTYALGQTQDTIYIKDTGDYTLDVQNNDQKAIVTKNVTGTISAPPQPAANTTNLTDNGSGTSAYPDYADWQAPGEWIFRGGSSDADSDLDLLRLHETEPITGSVNWKVQSSSGKWWEVIHRGGRTGWTDGRLLIRDNRIIFNNGGGSDANDLYFKSSGTPVSYETEGNGIYGKALSHETPKLNFDTYNKLTIANVDSDATSNIDFFSNTYEMGSRKELIINDTGTYYANIYSSNTLALVKKEIITESGAKKVAFHHGAFSASDYSSAYSTVEAAATAGHVYSDTSTTPTYTWGTLGTISSTSTNTTYTWTPASTGFNKADILMVAGGGGGSKSSHSYAAGAGGGAGGLVYKENQSISGVQTIIVGNGGASGNGGTDGQNTTALGFTALGGGGGATSGQDGNNGGSGGGGDGSSTTNSSSAPSVSNHLSSWVSSTGDYSVSNYRGSLRNPSHDTSAKTYSYYYYWEYNSGNGNYDSRRDNVLVYNYGDRKWYDGRNDEQPVYVMNGDATTYSGTYPTSSDPNQQTISLWSSSVRLGVFNNPYYDSSWVAPNAGGSASQPSHASGGFGNSGGQGGGAQTGGGGGGGAGSVGQDGNTATGNGGNGGDGKMYSISGSNVYYAGGGGAGTGTGGSVAGTGGQGGGGNGGQGNGGNGGNGSSHTGGGGGGSNKNSTAGNGGSGVVIIKTGGIVTIGPPPDTNIAFHHDTFANSGDPYSDGSVTAAATAGHIFSDTATGTYTWGTLDSASLSGSNNTTYTWTPASTITAKVLMVAGGGGGGTADNNNGGGGGGGAGGLVYNADVSLSGQKTITVGGSAGIGSPGKDTAFSGLTTASGGGKAGGSSTGANGFGGGSGGGAFRNGTGGAGTSGQGYAGGTGSQTLSPVYNQGGSGGGGAGGAGVGATSVTDGANGGAGLDYSGVFGTTYGDSGWFASGGAGGHHAGGSPGTASSGGGGNGGSGSGSAGVNGQNHTGGGGGGGSVVSGGHSYGGSGIVLVQIPSASPSLTFDGYNKLTAPVLEATFTATRLSDWDNSNQSKSPNSGKGDWPGTSFTGESDAHWWTLHNNDKVYTSSYNYGTTRDAAQLFTTVTSSDWNHGYHTQSGWNATKILKLGYKFTVGSKTLGSMKLWQAPASYPTGDVTIKYWDGTSLKTVTNQSPSGFPSSISYYTEQEFTFNSANAQYWLIECKTHASSPSTNYIGLAGWQLLSGRDPVSTVLTKGSDSYDIGTASSIYIDAAGTYDAQAKNSNTFVIKTSNVVSGSITRSQIWKADGTEDQILYGSDPGADDNFGHAVAVDGNYAVVGSRYNDTGGTDRGAAFIFHKSGGTWTEQAMVQPSDTANDDWFGRGVAISGDYVIVNAYAKTTNNTGQGAAYIFYRSGTSWAQQAKLNASDSEASDAYSYSVDIDGDYAIVGSLNEDPGGTSNAGSAYIYVRSGTSWSQQAKIQASDKEASDTFGRGVTISGDYAAVGADNEDTSGSNAGSVYIFKYDATYPPDDLPPVDSVGTGFNYKRYTALDTSTHYVYKMWRNSAGDWRTPSPASANTIKVLKTDSTDWSDNDTTDTNPTYIDTTTYSGKVSLGQSGPTENYRFSVPTFGRWSEQQKIQSSDIQADDYFGGGAGQGVSLSGDYLAVGARKEDTGGSEAGSVYIFKRGTTSLNTVGHAIPDEHTSYYGASDWICQSVSGTVGIYKHIYRTGTPVDSGLNTLQYDSSTSTWSDHGTGQPEKFTKNDTNWSNRSSTVTNVQAGDVIRGWKDNTNAQRGQFTQPSSGNIDIWSQEAKLQASDVSAAAQFGMSVSLSGDVLAVGANAEDTSASDAGAAYIFERSGTTWTEVKKITASDTQASDYFGESISTDGTTTFVGAFGEDTKGSNAGAAYVYEKQYVGPTLTYDNSNKLSLTGVTTPSSNLTVGTNTYDIGSAKDVYIKDQGTYTFHTNDGDQALILNKTVSSTPSGTTYNYTTGTAYTITTDSLFFNYEAWNYSGSGNWLNQVNTANNPGVIPSSITYNSTSPKSFVFNNSNTERINIGNVDMQQDWTLECWAKFSDLSANRGLFGHGVHSTQEGLHINVGNNGSYTRLGFYSNDLDATFSFQVDTWYHLVYVYDRTNSHNKKIYINGVKEADANQSSYNRGTDEFSIGNTYSNGVSGNQMQGEIAVARMYTKCLTAQEIGVNYAAGYLGSSTTTTLSGTLPSQVYDNTKTITVSNIPSGTSTVGKIYKGATAYTIHVTEPTSNVIIKNTGSYVSVFTTSSTAYLTNTVNVNATPTTTSEDTTIEDESTLVTVTTTTVQEQDPETFSYTGAIQTYTVPDGVTSIKVKCWGAAGGARNGGAGGYAGGDVSVTPGDTIQVVVGQGGRVSSSANYLGGGGGFTGILSVWNTSDISATHAGSIVIAGAGGGGANSDNNPAGNGGGETGGVGQNSNGGAKPGTQTAAGSAESDSSGASNPSGGSYFRGGNSAGNSWYAGTPWPTNVWGGNYSRSKAGGGSQGGGGGGGYYGAGGAGNRNSVNSRGAAGGSGYIGGDGTHEVTTGENLATSLTEKSSLPPKTDDEHYVSGAGTPATTNADGGHGLVVVIPLKEVTTTTTTGGIAGSTAVPSASSTTTDAPSTVLVATTEVAAPTMNLDFTASMSTFPRNLKRYNNITSSSIGARFNRTHSRKKRVHKSINTDTFSIELTANNMGDSSSSSSTLPVTVVNSGAGTQYESGWTTAGSTSSFVVPSDAPNALYYYSQNDDSAGGSISVSSASTTTHTVTVVSSSAGTQYTSGWTASGTPGSSGGINTFIAPSNAPSTLYYYCGNHSGMGGAINMVSGPVSTTFAVTVQSVSGYYGSSSNYYFIDGTQQATISLVRGKTYTFNNNASGSHPMYITTSSDGTTYTSGVTNGGTSSVTFAVPLNAPSTLYYKCGNHGGMGGTINILGPTASPLAVTVAGGKFVIGGVSQATLQLVRGETYVFNQENSSNGTHPLRLSTTSNGTHVSGGSGFYIGGTQRPTLSMVRGNTYTFDQTNASNGSHVLQIATASDGTQYTSGYTTGTFVVPLSAPSTLYYKSSTTAGMGGLINVTGSSTSAFNVTFSGGKFSIGGVEQASLSVIRGLTYTFNQISGHVLSLSSTSDGTRNTGVNKYYISGVETPTLTFIRGSTYTFTQATSTNTGHPIRLSTTSNGTHASGSQYTSGWTTTGTPGSSGASSQFIVPADAPSTLYYYCQHHSGMGGASSINVADSNSGIILTYGTHALVANSTVSGEYTIATNFDGTTSNLYVNGDLITQTTPTIASGAKMLKIGEDYNGLIKNLKFWNYAKSFLVTFTKVVFHYGSFDSVYGDADVNAAAAAGHVFDNTPAGTYPWGTITLPSTASNQTTYTWTLSGAITVDVLMVAGGGGGGGSVGGGGGGAGGLLHHTNQTISSGQKTIVVGDGGTGGIGYGHGDNNGEDGKDTTFTGFDNVIGGGGGGSHPGNGSNTQEIGRTGGSAGGSAYNTSTNTSGTSGQGYGGGGAADARAGGGGGGAAGAGINGSSSSGGNGGTGVDKSSIFTTTYGDSGWFASGGGGGGRTGNASAGTASQGGGSSGKADNSRADDAQNHTGGGGGGGGYTGANSAQQGGDGGSGIVIVIAS